MARRMYRFIDSKFDAVSSAVDQLDRRAEKMEVILMVREPGSAAAAEAYDGLRRQVVVAVNERFTQLTQLVQFDSALRNGADLEVLRKMVDGWCEAAALVQVFDPDHPDANELFDLVEDRGGHRLQVIEPAYVDQHSGRIIRRGRAMRMESESEDLGHVSPGEEPGDGMAIPATEESA